MPRFSGGPRATRRYRVLFVCIGNACRSQMAEAFARVHAPDVIEPASCGIAPVQMVAPLTQTLMLERGIDVSRQYPKGVVQAGVGFDLIVNMSGQKLPRAVAPVREWVVEDPYWLDEARHREIRDEIEARVLELAAELRRAARVAQNSI